MTSTVHTTHKPAERPGTHEMSQPQTKCEKPTRILFASFAVSLSIFLHYDVSTTFSRCRRRSRLIHTFLFFHCWLLSSLPSSYSKTQLLSPPPFSGETILRFNSNRTHEWNGAKLRKKMPEEWELCTEKSIGLARNRGRLDWVENGKRKAESGRRQTKEKFDINWQNRFLSKETGGFPQFICCYYFSFQHSTNRSTYFLFDSHTY